MHWFIDEKWETASIKHDDCHRCNDCCCSDRMKGSCWCYMCIEPIISVQLCESIETHVCSPATFNTYCIFVRAKITIAHEDYYDYCLWWIHTSPDKKLIAFDRTRNKKWMKSAAFLCNQCAKRTYWLGVDLCEMNGISRHLTWMESNRSAGETEKRISWNFSSDCHRICDIHHAFRFEIFWQPTLDVYSPTDL